MIKVPEKDYGIIFGKRVLNTCYELTISYDSGGEYSFFFFGIADASYKKEK